MPTSPTTARSSPLEHLNPEQRAAAECVRGPVAILAGAGTGKTTTITHRIAQQVLTGAFEPRQILAVTFTEKAARELKERLARLDVRGVEARTFHSTAWWQLQVLWSEYTGQPLGSVVASKYALLAPLVQRLRMPYKFRPVREFATQIEWAKNRRVTPKQYVRAIAREGIEPPVPADLMQKVYAGYEERKARAGKIDFEDMLTRAVDLFDEHPAAIERIRERFAAFTVDEYQDVNPLQQALLERWLGERDDVCVVGDDYQTIYSFTGASPEQLLEFPNRYRHAHVVRLERNYRSTPQVLALANLLVPQLGGYDKRLAATHDDGPEPLLRAFDGEGEEVDWVVEQCRLLHAHGTAWEQMAVLYRLNARSEAYEERFAAAGVPFQVRSGAFLRRPGTRGVIAQLKRAEQPGVAFASGGDLVKLVGRVVVELGYDPRVTSADDEEATRQADLERMVQLVKEFAAAREASSDAVSVAGFLTELERRFAAEEQGRGVQLMTLHRAKGLEFDAVFLPHLCEGELPYKHRGAEADPDEERRLLYVGITRARRLLHLSWSGAKPSRFLAELGVERAAATAGGAGKKARGGAARGTGAAPVGLDAADEALYAALREWRREQASQAGKPAYVIFHDATLAAIASARPKSLSELGGVSGVGPAKLERYGESVVDVVSAALV